MRVKDGEKCTMCQEHFGPEGAYLLGTCGHPWHLACLAKFSLASRSCYCKAPIHRRFYRSIGQKAFMPPEDGLYNIETRYKIQHGNTVESILQELRSLPEGCNHGFANLKTVGTILAKGGLLASTEKAYIRTKMMVEVGRYRGSTRCCK